MKQPVKSAVLLLAGRGSRLEQLTDELPKCLIQVNGISILERMLEQLSKMPINECILVVGYMSNKIIDSIGYSFKHLKIKYVNNSAWEKTNNIISLHMAIPHIEHDFILAEGDIIVSENAMRKLLSQNMIAIDKFRPFMDGTIVNVSNKGIIDRFYLKGDEDYPKDPSNYYKTVNIYSFTYADFMTSIYPKLTKSINSNKLNSYYELAIAEAVQKNEMVIRPAYFGEHRWSEIDTQRDLFYAERMFKSIEN